MIATIRRLLFPIIILIVLGFILMLISQIGQVYQLASGLNPTFGQLVLYCLLLVCGTLILAPVLLFYRLPGPLKRPKTEEEVPEFRKKLARRLTTNSLIKNSNFGDVNLKKLDEALILLDKEADKTIHGTANIVFLTTSISQNGKLDAFTVLITQVRMVWKIAHIYYQRPGLRELIYLYAAVGGSAFLASEIEDLDISRQIEPIASSVLRGSSSRTVPLIGPAATLILDSIIEGSTNAYLTLRVGIIAKKYCGHPNLIDKKQLRRESLKEAAVRLKQITFSASGKIIAEMLKATKNAGVDTIKTGWYGVINTGKKVGRGLAGTSRKLNPFAKRAN